MARGPGHLNIRFLMTNTSTSTRTTPEGITLNKDGYFRRNGERFVPVGVNYWPASCGVEMWAHWPVAEIQHDLDVLAPLGLNCIRFFLRWEDFEPEAGVYDQTQFERLAQFLQWCVERDIVAQPTLFVGFMSGGIYWPQWKGERNLFADGVMLERSAAFAREAARVIQPFHSHIMGIDQGNELCCLPESREAPPAAVENWCQAVCAAVRETYPEAMMVSGNEQNQIVADTGWRLGQQGGTDYYSMHAYPVPNWHPITFDGLMDPLAHTLLPFYIKVARAFGPVLAQEFGSIVTMGTRPQDTYLRAILPACWEAGANGFLWWCLRDITATVQPYIKNSFESTLGLIDADDQIKPGLEYFLEFARSRAAAPAPDEPATIGLYWAKNYYPRDNPADPGNEPALVAPRLTAAHYMLQSLGHHVAIVRGDLPLENIPDALVVCGARLDGQEIAALETWVRAGGKLLWHGPDPFNWNPCCARLLGAVPVDYRAHLPVSIDFGGRFCTFATFPRGLRAEVETTSAVVVARDQDGVAVVLKHKLEAGSVVCALPLVEDSIISIAGQRAARDEWKSWYQAALELL